MKSTKSDEERAKIVIPELGAMQKKVIATLTCSARSMKNIAETSTDGCPECAHGPSKTILSEQRCQADLVSSTPAYLIVESQLFETSGQTHEVVRQNSSPP